MPHFRKLPVTIQAIQWDGTNIAEIEDFLGMHGYQDATTWVIHTLEGDMTAQVGDYIIRGVKGEFYPCNPDIFTQTYEPDAEADAEARRNAPVTVTLTLGQWRSIYDLADRGADICDAFDQLTPLRNQLSV